MWDEYYDMYNEPSELDISIQDFDFVGIEINKYYFDIVCERLNYEL